MIHLEVDPWQKAQNPLAWLAVEEQHGREGVLKRHRRPWKSSSVIRIFPFLFLTRSRCNYLPSSQEASVFSSLPQKRAILWPSEKWRETACHGQARPYTLSTTPSPQSPTYSNRVQTHLGLVYVFKIVHVELVWSPSLKLFFY